MKESHSIFDISPMKKSAYTALMGVLGSFLILQYLLVNSDGESFTPNTLEKILLLGAGVAITFMASFSMQFLNRYLSWRKNAGARLFVGILAQLVASIMIMIVGLKLYRFLLGETYVNAEVQTQLFIKAGILLLILILLYHIIYFALYSWNQYANAQIERLSVERKQIDLQLKALKAQLSPHFLFNSLNAISSLVETNPIMAEEFIRKLAKLYQYTLESYEKPWVSLQEELSFVQAYQYLLHTRFKDALSVRIDVPEEMLQKSVPPLTLQMLVENAVKHNQMSAEQPLQVDISMLDQWISVSNNITEAPINASSFQIGLSNIRERYRILADKEVEVVSGDSFTVKLPIL